MATRGKEIGEPTPVAVGADRAARLLGVSKRTVFGLIERRQLASFRIGRRRLIRVKDIENFAEARAEAATP